MEAARVDDLPPHARALAELLARQPRFRAAGGRRKRIELLFEDDILVEAIVHDRIGGRELEEHAIELMPAESPA